MSEPIPDDHPLSKLFCAALDRAFQEHAELYSPRVSTHLHDEVLCDFVRSDRLYRLQSGEGDPLASLPRMLDVSVQPEGPERRLEVDSYIGDFALFMVGFFPSALRRGRWSAGEALVSRVGKIFVKFEQPLEYYAAEGRNAYGRAAETARLFAPPDEEVFALLSRKFDGYLEVLRKVRTIIAEDPGSRAGELLIEG